MNRYVLIATWVVSLTLFSVKPHLFAAETKGLESITLKVDPPNPKPGQTMTVLVEVKLAKDHYTYPTQQITPEAQLQTSRFQVIKSKEFIVVGGVIDPKGGEIKKEGELEYLIYPNGGIFSQKVVVSPKIPEGEYTIQVKFRPLICTKDNCYPPKDQNLSATIKVSGPPVPVEEKYQAAVEKALKD